MFTELIPIGAAEEKAPVKGSELAKAIQLAHEKAQLSFAQPPVRSPRRYQNEKKYISQRIVFLPQEYPAIGDSPFRMCRLVDEPAA